jgi:membrane associated rhomboid family serine protease
MKNYLLKIKSILLPYILSLVSVLLFCSIFNWIFIILLDWIPVTDFIINFVFPFCISALVVLFFLNKRIKLLKFKNDKSDFFYFVTIVGIAVPTIIAQMYLETATGKLTDLDDVYKFDQQAKTKYYTIKQYYLYTKGYATFESIETSGKHNEKLDFTFYFITPIFKKPADTLKSDCRFWFCTRYYYSMSNRSDTAEKNAAYINFINASRQEYKNESFYFTYLEQLKHSDDLKEYKKAFGNSYFENDPKEVVFFKPHKDDYTNRNGEKLIWILWTSLISIGAVGLLLLAFQLKSATELSRDKKREAREKAKDWRIRYAWAIPQKDFFFTPILIYLNLFVFVGLVFVGAGFISFDYENLYDWGGVIRNEVLTGAWWRLMSAVFLHGGIMHLLNNMLGLYFAGLFLEPLLGKWRYLLVYLLCGVGASLTSVFWHERTLSVGASGAIFGLYGFMLLLSLLKQFQPSQNKMIMVFAGIFVVYNLIMGLVGGVDNAAHLGGLICGFFLGALLTNSIKESE